MTECILCLVFNVRSTNLANFLGLLYIRKLQTDESVKKLHRYLSFLTFEISGLFCLPFFKFEIHPSLFD